MHKRIRPRKGHQVLANLAVGRASRALQRELCALLVQDQGQQVVQTSGCLGGIPLACSARKDLCAVASQEWCISQVHPRLTSKSPPSCKDLEPL